MKNLTTLTTVLILTLAFCSFAADQHPTYQTIPTVEENVPQLPCPGYTGLAIHPMIEEITKIEESMEAREEILLISLNGAQSEPQANAIIEQIMQLDIEREMAILKVHMRFARLEGKFELENEIRNRISAIIDSEMAVLP